MVHSIHVSRHTVYWVQAQVGFGRVYFPGPNRVGAPAHFMRWAQPILRLSRRACARANDGLASINAGQPLMKNLSHFVKSVLYLYGSKSKHGTITQFCFNVGAASYTIDRHLTGIGWVCPHCVYQVHRIGAYTDLSVMVLEGIGLHVEDILVSLVLSIIISWTFRILAHEENQYSFVYKFFFV